MWGIYQTAKGSHCRPSQLLKIEDEWAALQLDAAVVLVGQAIEGAAQERINAGSDEEPDWQFKYSVAQMCEPDFRFPPPPKPPTEEDRQRAAIEVLKGWASMSGGAVRHVKVPKQEGE